MRNFTYARAANLDEAVRAAAAGAALIAGSTELLNWMRLGIAAPERLVDISALDGLRGIAMDGDTLVIGALATLNEVGANALVRENAPVLAEAALRAASAQLRNRATIGGNVLQKTRCPYFRAEAANPERLPWPCNKRRPGSGCAALGGHYERGALFGWTEDCAATQPSDPAVALAALDAVAEVTGPDAARTIAMTDFHLTQQEAAALKRSGESRTLLANGLSEIAGSEALIETRLRPGEVIRGYRVPIDAAARSSAYLKVRERESYEYAMVSAAVCLATSGGTIGVARIALGAVAQKPWRLRDAEAALVGASLDEAALTEVMTAALAGARPLPGQDWKPRLAANAAARAVMMAAGEA